jgi:hypothetical protein
MTVRFPTTLFSPQTGAKRLFFVRHLGFTGLHFKGQNSQIVRRPLKCGRCTVVEGFWT